MKVAIINTLPVPSGQASVNRFLGYAKGLVKLGDQVTCLSSAKPVDIMAGETDGVSFINYGTGGKLSLLKSLRQIRGKIKVEKYDAVIVVSNSLLMLYPVFCTCRKIGTNFIMEKSEFPLMMMRDGQEVKSGWKRWYGCLWVKAIGKMLDGMIVMTTPLLEYFKPRVNKNCRLVHIPMTVDTSRFEIERTNSEYGKYIAYCGNMTGNKDGVENLIEAFKEVEPAFPDIKLLLIGGCNTKAQFEARKQYVEKTGLKNVVFYGKAPRDEMPKLLKNAMMLCLARPTTTQATYGFPTKLGEYLSTGNPIVVTAVGDIPRYLTNENSYIVKADDNHAFALRISEVLDNYGHAVEVGARGKELAKTVFNAEVQSKVLHEWLTEFNKL